MQRHVLSQSLSIMLISAQAVAKLKRSEPLAGSRVVPRSRSGSRFAARRSWRVWRRLFTCATGTGKWHFLAYRRCWEAHPALRSLKVLRKCTKEWLYRLDFAPSKSQELSEKSNLFLHPRTTAPRLNGSNQARSPNMEHAHLGDNSCS